MSMCFFYCDMSSNQIYLNYLSPPARDALPLQMNKYFNIPSLPVYSSGKMNKYKYAWFMPWALNCHLSLLVKPSHPK